VTRVKGQFEGRNTVAPLLGDGSYGPQPACISGNADLDHIPTLLFSPEQPLDPKQNEFRIVSPVLIRGNGRSKPKVSARPTARLCIAISFPIFDCRVVQQEKLAGAIIIGKSNVPEFGLGSQTFNPVFGIIRTI
jgi:hypothetical protein